MRILIVLFCFIIIIACSKTNDDQLSATDASAVAAMEQQITGLKQTSNSLAAASTPAQRQYWDSIYHHQDSVFWYHHNLYNHENGQTHADHHHSWMAYDPAINHNHHYHPSYPGHHNDSLVHVSNGHHTGNEPHHHQNIHNLHHHQTLDSLHHIHQSFH